MANAAASGIAVAASPKLWMRSASRAIESLATKMIVWTIAVTARTASESTTARMPLRERLMLGSMRPCEWGLGVVGRAHFLELRPTTWGQYPCPRCTGRLTASPAALLRRSRIESRMSSARASASSRVWLILTRTRMMRWSSLAGGIL